VERLDLDVAEVNLRAFGLQPDWAFSQLTLAGGDLGAVDLAGNHAILARDLGRVPLADGVARLLEGLGVELVAALGAHDGEDLAVLAVHALDLHALGPDLVLAPDVNEQAAVAGKLLLVFEIGGPLVPPVVADDVVLVTLVGVEVAVGVAGDDDDPLLDRESLGRVGVLLGQHELPAGEVGAVEQRLEAFVLAPGRDWAEPNQGDDQGGQRQPGTQHAVHRGAPSAG